MLPTVEPSMIPPTVLPLLIFVNVKSGGCQVIIVLIIEIIMIMIIEIIIVMSIEIIKVMVGHKTGSSWSDFEGHTF